MKWNVKEKRSVTAVSVSEHTFHLCDVVGVWPSAHNANDILLASAIHTKPSYWHRIWTFCRNYCCTVTRGVCVSLGKHLTSGQKPSTWIPVASHWPCENQSFHIFILQLYFWKIRRVRSWLNVWKWHVYNAYTKESKTTCKALCLFSDKVSYEYLSPVSLMVQLNAFLIN